MLKDNRKPVVEINPNTSEIINKFYSGKEAAKKCFISTTSISKCCNGVRKHAGDRIFMFEEDYQKMKQEKIS